MQHSAEVRWFVGGSLPIQTIRWFCAGQPLSPEERTDRYLVFPGCESVGVKIRQGNFEIKALKGRLGIVRFPSEVTGRADCWAKWSYSQQPVQAWTRALAWDRHGWIDVAKTRWLRAFSVDGGQAVEVAAGQRLDKGCLVELTRIVALNREWWSVALEAFGDPAEVQEVLRRTGESFFSAHPPLDPLHVTASCSYPAWLAGLEGLLA